nr:MAG TPA: hypothetical protein [Caudoviricetes sp.]
MSIKSILFVTESGKSRENFKKYKKSKVSQFLVTLAFFYIT